MNLHKQLLTNNDCYKAGKKITVKGLLLHSTGANNPKLSRYIGPDDGLLGTPSPNNWNQPKPEGRQVCVHGFIGLDVNGVVRTYQTLPWDHRGWHCGGTGNDTHIGIEICEGDLTDASYFNKVYNEAVELFAYLCKQLKLTEANIIDHSEAYKKGIASNHGDVMHWFPKHGKSMNTFRADVKKLLGGGTVTPPTPLPTVDKTIDELAREVIAGKHGTGEARKQSLGDKYDAVQKRVNEILSGGKTASTPAAKTIEQLAQEVIRGMHGSGRERMISLGNQYAAVQKEVNRLMGQK